MLEATHAENEVIAMVMRCPYCALNQYARGACRRCRKSMLPEEPVIHEAVPVDDSLPGGYSFGARLRTLRRFRGLSQRQIAARMGCQRTYISKHEKGWIPYGPHLEQIERAAEALEVPQFAMIEPDEALAFAAIAVKHMTEAQRNEVLAWLSTRTPKVTA